MVSLKQISDTDAVRLIAEVKKRPCIWNPEDDNYSERYHLSKAWDDIAQKMDMPEDLIRGKWKNLRDFFKKEVKKYNVETVDEYCGRWRHFQSLGFLLREGEEQTGSEVEIDQADTSEFETKFVPDSNLEVFIDEPVPKKRPKTSDDDYDMMFLKSLTPFLKQLEPTRNLVVRSRIQDLLLNEIAAQEANRCSAKRSESEKALKGIRLVDVHRLCA